MTQFTAPESTVTKTTLFPWRVQILIKCEKPQPTTAVTDKNELQGGSQWEHS